MKVHIDILADLQPSMNGCQITAAPSVMELHAILGPPSRVVDPHPPAPIGHRNNQVHIYDDLGLEFREHHYTRRIVGGTMVFWPDEYFHNFRPSAGFTGTLILAGYVVPSAPTVMELLKASPIEFQQSLRGVFSARRGEFYVGIRGKGEKLPTGRRSSRLMLIDVSFAWPHDNWGHPSGV
jgi:hypothetical protein